MTILSIPTILVSFLKDDTHQKLLINKRDFDEKLHKIERVELEKEEKDSKDKKDPKDENPKDKDPKDEIPTLTDKVGDDGKDKE